MPQPTPHAVCILSLFLLPLLVGCAGGGGGAGYVGTWQGEGGSWQIDPAQGEALRLAVNDAGAVAVTVDTIAGKDFLLPETDEPTAGWGVLRLDRQGDRLRVWALDANRAAGRLPPGSLRADESISIDVSGDAQAVGGATGAPMTVEILASDAVVDEAEHERAFDGPRTTPNVLDDLVRHAREDDFLLIADLQRAG